MTDVPAPLTPADCNLRGFQWMPIDVVRLLDSDLFLIASGDEFKAALALWCKSWSQVPAASLPADERLLAGLSGAKNWKKVRDVAMRGWVMCSDGRWYHPVVAEKALEAQVIAKQHADQKHATNERKRLEREDRQRLFSVLRERGIVPDFHIKTTDLRDLVRNLPPLPVDGNVTRDKSQGVTAKTGQDQTGQNQTGPDQTAFSYSAPTGAGGEPPEPPPPAPPVLPAPPKAAKVKTAAEEEQSRIWASLKVALVDQKTSPDHKAAGVLLGAMASKYGRDVFLEAGRTAIAANPVDTHTYLVSLCETAAGKRQRLGGAPAASADVAQASLDKAARLAAAMGGSPGTPGQQVMGGELS